MVHAGDIEAGPRLSTVESSTDSSQAANSHDAMLDHGPTGSSIGHKVLEHGRNAGLTLDDNAQSPYLLTPSGIVSDMR